MKTWTGHGRRRHARALYRGCHGCLPGNKIVFEGAIGTSAGAVFGCNYKSNQPGRVLRYNLKYGADPRYGSLRSLLLTGDFYNKDFAYREVPFEKFPFDTETFQKNPMEFYVVCTDVETGRPFYYRCDKGDLHGCRVHACFGLDAAGGADCRGGRA